jgi:hypothetical protein
MDQAQRQLAQSQPQSAQASMARSAQALRQSAQQMTSQRSQQQGLPQPVLAAKPSERGAAGQGMIDVSRLGKDFQKYAGKSWGEVPGELRTRFIQDMREKYGDNYARMIKLYFEQVAETKEK